MAEPQPQLRQLQGQQQYPAQGLGIVGGRPCGSGGAAAGALNRQHQGEPRKSAPAAAYRNQVRALEAAQGCPVLQGQAYRPAAAFPWQRQQPQQPLVSSGVRAAPTDQSLLANARAEHTIQNAPAPVSCYQRQQLCISQEIAQTGKAAHQEQAILQAAQVQQQQHQQPFQAALTASQVQPAHQRHVRHTGASGGTGVPATGPRSGPAVLQRCNSGPLLPPQSGYQRSPAVALSQRRHSGPLSAGYTSTPPTLLGQRSNSLHLPQPEQQHSGANTSLRQIMMSARKPQHSTAQQSPPVEASVRQGPPEMQQQQQQAPVSRSVVPGGNNARHQQSGTDANQLHVLHNQNHQGAYKKGQPQHTQHMPPDQTVPAVPAQPELGGWQCHAMDIDNLGPAAAAAAAAPPPAHIAPARQEVWQKKHSPPKLSEATCLAGQQGEVPYSDQPGSTLDHGLNPGKQVPQWDAQPLAQDVWPPAGLGKQPLRQLLSQWGLPAGVVEASLGRSCS